jgi:hypothetical protein
MVRKKKVKVFAEFPQKLQEFKEVLDENYSYDNCPKMSKVTKD